jgi:hypothetical protein
VSIGAAGFSEPSFSKKWVEAIGAAFGATEVVPPVRKERPSGRRAEQVVEVAAERWTVAAVRRAVTRR